MSSDWQDTEYEDRQALSLRQLEALAEASDLQSHTRNHPILPSCPSTLASGEILGSADDLERLIGARPRGFAYPNGDYSERDIELVRAAGYECAFTVEPGYNSADTDHYRLKRVLIADDAGETELVACASGAYAILARIIRRVLRLQSP